MLLLIKNTFPQPRIVAIFLHRIQAHIRQIKQKMAVMKNVQVHVDFYWTTRAQKTQGDLMLAHRL